VGAVAYRSLGIAKIDDMAATVYVVTTVDADFYNLIKEMIKN